MKTSRDPYNKVGRFILEELAAKGVSYHYACKFKRSNHETPLPQHSKR